MVNYNKSTIYKLCCKDTEITDEYVGSTTNFSRRKAHHKSKRLVILITIEFISLLESMADGIIGIWWKLRNIVLLIKMIYIKENDIGLRL